MRSVVTILGRLGITMMIPISAWAAEPAAVIPAQVVDGSKDAGVVGLDAGEQSGIAVGDICWLIRPDGAAAEGEVFLVTPSRSAVRLAGDAEAVSPGEKAVVLRRAALVDLRDRMPAGATLCGRVARVPPGRHTAWIDLTTRSGLRQKDYVLVSRKGLPISRGRIEIVDERAALATLEPLVRNALPEAGDRVELWPTPSDAHWGSLSSTVLRVSEAPEGTLDRVTIDLAGSDREGVAVERPVDVYRGRQYVGTGQIVSLAHPNSRAKMLDVATFLRPAEGDRAIVRPAPQERPHPLLAPVYKVDGEDCYVTAGELDGVKEGDKLLVRRQDPADATVWHDVAELTVDYVAPAHCGAKIRPLTSQVAGVQRGDLAERSSPGLEQWRAVGIVESMNAGTRTAVAAVEPHCPVQAGTVVACIPEKDAPPGAAIAIYRDNDRLILYCPPGWADADALPHARIDAVKQ